MDTEAKGYSEIVLAQILFAFMYIFVRFVPSFGTYNLAFSRVLLSAVIFLGLALIYKKYKIQKIKKEKIKLLIFGAMHGFIIIAAYVSIYYLTVAASMLLQSTLSIWMAIFSCLLLKEKMSSRVIFSLIISFVGLVVLLSPSDFFIKKSLIGILAGLFVGVFGGLVYVMSKTFKSYDAFSLTFWQNLIATPFLIPLLFLQRPTVSAFNITFVIIIALCGAFGFFLLFSGLRRVRGTLASLLPMLNIILTIILAIFFFGEIPSVKEIVGGVLILIGIYNTIRK